VTAAITADTTRTEPVDNMTPMLMLLVLVTMMSSDDGMFLNTHTA
jgi:hypothetical protein